MNLNLNGMVSMWKMRELVDKATNIAMFEQEGLRGDPRALPAVPQLAWYGLFDPDSREELRNTLLAGDDVQNNAAGTRRLRNKLEVAMRDAGIAGGAGFDTYLGLRIAGSYSTADNV